jgi:K+-transporting ATPase A subunit
MCKFKSGLGGMPAAVSRSFSRPYADRESHANRFKTYTNRYLATWVFKNKIVFFLVNIQQSVYFDFHGSFVMHKIFKSH